jgi:soluble lytic murein transglycosylase
VVFLSLTACTRSAVTPPPPPTPAPAAAVTPEPEPVAVTLNEARALRQSGDAAAYERSLEALVTSPDEVTRRRAQTLLALHLFDSKRYDDAIPALTTAASLHPLTAPFIQLRLVEAEASRGNLAAAINTANGIVANAPGTSAATIARLRLPALHARNGDNAATEVALAGLSSVVIDELTEQDFVDLGSLLSAAGRDDLATQLRFRVLRDYPQGRFTEKVYGQLAIAQESPLDALPLPAATGLASDLGRVNRYDQVLDLLKRIATRFPDAASNETYRAVRVRSLFNSRNYTQLLEETEGVKLDSPALEMLRARAAWRAERPEAFLAGLNDIEKRHPKSKEAIEAKVARAKYYVTDETDYERSVDNLKKAIDAGAIGNDGENLWTLGWTYVLWGKDDEALRVFDKYLATFADGDYRTNSLFWSGKLYDKRGDTAARDAKLQQVIAEYPYNYYAYRARQILGLPTVAPSEIPGGAAFPDIDGQLRSTNDSRIDAVRELMAVDLTRDATREMKTVAAAYPDNAGISFLLADIYVAGGEPFKANGILQRKFRQIVRHGGTNVPPRFWQILYPLNYWDTIRTEAERRSVDPYLLASIIRQESGFEPTVVSNAGAVGLMQIMPQEAARIASLAGIEGMTRERLFDPVENIAVGAAEYMQKLSAMNGNDVLAIAAYNAGETPVGRWLARTSIDDRDMFIESIPYAETRLYVKSVTRNRFEYRRIYESSTGVQSQ